MDKKLGTIVSINGNMISVKCIDSIIQNEVGYVIHGDERMKAEVIKTNKDIAFMQVFESTKDLKIGDKIDFSGEMLSV